MSFENASQINNEINTDTNVKLDTKESHIDQDLYDRYMEVKISFLKETRPDVKTTDEQKEKFLNGEINSIHLTYEKNSKIDYNKKEFTMLRFKEELRQELLEAKRKKDKKRETLIQSYLWVVNEKIAKIRLLKEGQLMNSRDVDFDKRAKKFQRYTEFIYGKPETSIFSGVIERLVENLDKLSIDKLDDTQKESLKRLKKVAGNFNEKVAGHDYPKFTYPKDINESELVTDTEEIKRYFLEALSDLGLLQSGWSVEVDSGGKRFAFSVDTSSKKILIPSAEQLENRQKGRETTISNIKGLIAHEIKTHALRASRGEESRLKLLTVGLDRYLVGEEGLATYREHQETGAEDFSGFTNYFAIGLAYGLDDGRKKNFTEVFNILFDYYHAVESKSMVEAKEMAWKRAYRTFRGTSGDIPGLVLTRDLVYRKGNIATYKLMSKDGSEKIDLNVGKYDQTNPRHINLLIEFGILDTDLQRLDLWSE